MYDAQSSQTMGEYQTRCARGTYTGLFCSLFQLIERLLCPVGNPKTFMICMCTFPIWQACNLSCFSLLLHCLHVSSLKALTPCHNSSPRNPHQGTEFTRASKVDHFLEKLFKYLMRCANSPLV